MAHISATYNSVTIQPLLSWTESVTAVFASAGKAVTGYRHVFQIDGFFDNTGGNATARQTDFDTIVAKMRESGQDLTITQGGVDIRSFDAADCQGTGPWSTFSIDGTDNPLKRGFNVPFSLMIEGVTDPPTVSGSKTSDTYTDRYAYDKQLRRIFTRSGQLSTASGTSAVAQFAGTDPVSGLPSGTTWELTLKDYQSDKEDQNLSYTWVYTEQHEANPTTAKNLQYAIRSAMQDGTEVWSATGSLSYELGTAITTDEIQTVLKNASAWPSGLHIVSESVNENARQGEVEFSILAEKPFGAGGTYSYQETVTTMTSRAVRDFHVFGGKGTDQRQELHRPTVVIVQEGSWVKDGAYPVEPAAVITDRDTTVEKEFVKGSIVYDVKGKARRYPLSWRIVMRPLNVTPPGQFRLAVDPTQNNPMTGSKASRTVG
jgi:hypothetical protein